MDGLDESFGFSIVGFNQSDRSIIGRTEKFQVGNQLRQEEDAGENDCHNASGNEVPLAEHDFLKFIFKDCEKLLHTSLSIPHIR